MRAKLLKETLTSLIPLGRAVAIEGPPGGGKTTIVHEVAKALNIPIIVRHMPTLLVEDFGIPFPTASEEIFEYKKPAWFPYKGKPGTENGGILLFDDRNQADADLQKVLANIQQARDLHGIPLADNWTIVSTGNRQNDRAGANRILSHLRDRETVLEFETHLDDSIAWMLDNGIRSEVISFLRFRPNHLHDFDPSRDKNATPRGWAEGVSPVLGNVPREGEYECFKGAVGEGAAAEFLGFLKIYRNLPDPDSIINNPDTAIVPTDISTLYAVAGILIDRITVDNIDKAMVYADRMPPEFAVMAISSSIRRLPILIQTKAIEEWMAKNNHVLF